VTVVAVDPLATRKHVAEDGVESQHATSEEAQPGLDEQRVFEGALAVQDVSLPAASIELLRSGAFADGTELRLSRLVDAQAAEAHLQLLAQAQQGRPLAPGERPGMRMAEVGSERIIHVERHGRDLLQVSARDEAERLARLRVQAVPVPRALALAAEPSATAAAG
jgi:hypothetical protein